MISWRRWWPVAHCTSQAGCGLGAESALFLGFQATGADVLHHLAKGYLGAHAAVETEFSAIGSPRGAQAEAEQPLGLGIEGVFARHIPEQAGTQVEEMLGRVAEEGRRGVG